MKVAIITDLHWGARNDSLNFIEFYRKFYENIFLPTLEKEKITTVLMLGDIFDRRKYSNHVSMYYAKKILFDKLAAMDIEVHMLVGNHDAAYKNTNEVNTPELLLNEYDNINVISTPQTIHLKYAEESHDICMIPWICPDNQERSFEEIKHTKAEICMGHLEISGFAMYRGFACEEGLDRKIFRKFDMTLSGHYHHRSHADGIYYVGNPYEMVWSDYQDPRGFHIMDLSTREMVFVQNTYTIFEKIIYDDTVTTIEEVTNRDYLEYKDKYVKIVVVNKTNPYLFDTFINKIYNGNPADVQIIEEFNDDFEFDGDIIEESKDTMTLLFDYVDGLSTKNMDTNKLKTILRTLYTEALNSETV